MGMAASQARLLTITARLHDVEYQAQSIQNAKIQLATKSDEVYKNYLEALDATTLTIKDDSGNIITANFNNLCGLNAANSGYNCALMDNKGRLIVPDDIAKGYEEFKKNNGGNDPYAFAIWMMGDVDIEDLNKSLKTIEDSVAAGTTNLNGKPDELEDIANEAYEKVLGEDYRANNQDLYDLSRDGLEDTIEKLKQDGNESGVKILTDALEKYISIEDSYRYKLYQQNAKEIFTGKAGDDSEPLGEEVDFNETEFNFYVEKFKEIQQAGGCISISSFDGNFNGDAASDSDWLQEQLKNGSISMAKVDTDKKTGAVSFNAESPTTSSSVSYTTTTTIDKTAYAKAEAEYEHETKEIDKKDKRYDMDLSKLETERTALTTEYDSVKKVISDNEERTFGIFS